jgi:LVIVD repeat
MIVSFMNRITTQPYPSSSPVVSITVTKGLSLRRQMGCFVLAIGLAVIPGNAFATLFVSSFGDGPNTGTIGAYTNSGAVINASLITGLNGPGSIAVSGGFLYVASGGKIGKYTTSGATVNASLITGLNPFDIEVSGNRIFVADFGHASIGEYTTSGATINSSLISGVHSTGIAVSGTHLFVASGSEFNGIAEYTTSGGTVNPLLIPNLSPFDVEVSGSNLFVWSAVGEEDVIGKYGIDGTAINPNLIPLIPLNTAFAVSGTDVFVVGDGFVSKYKTSGEVVQNPLISGLITPFGIAVEGPAAVPETFSTWWFGLTAAGLLALARTRKTSIS